MFARRGKFALLALAAALLLAAGWLWTARHSMVLAQKGATGAQPQPSEHRYTNRLIGEKSAYLLQHAHNQIGRAHV